jgi:N-methylhydantoinase B/oxoprolinase/acetone carboxylase alpha subunit
MKKDLDLNDIARFEKAIAKKYGPEAIENPRKHWNDEKEKSYQDQIKKLAEKELAFEEKDDKVEQDGFLISKKLLNKDTTRRSCPVCNTYSFKTRDDVFMNKFECCYNCYMQWVEGREERWKSGWRPNNE